MHRLSYLLIFGLLSQVTLAQDTANLVLNPGFEAHYGLPDGEGQVFKLKNWFNPSGGTGDPFGTPDFLHTWGANQAKLPNSYYGSVMPHSGNALAGFLAYAGWKKDGREYLAAPLAAPLQKGKFYRFSIWITNGTGNFYTGGSVAGLGVRFSPKKPQQFYARPITLEPQLLQENALFDTAWQQLSWTFQATDTFTYLTIGNFLPDSLTPYTHVRSDIATGAYYFVDDVQLIEIQSPIAARPSTPPVPPLPPAPPTTPDPVATAPGPVALPTATALPKRLGNRKVTKPQRLEVQSDTVRLLVYDPRAEDGDSISLAWNGQWLLNAHQVRNKPTEIQVVLVPGNSNTLVFYAHNLGTVPPNTAVVAYDTPDGKRQMVEVRNDLSRSGAITLVRRR